MLRTKTLNESLELNVHNLTSHENIYENPPFLIEPAPDVSISGVTINSTSGEVLTLQFSRACKIWFVKNEF